MKKIYNTIAKRSLKQFNSLGDDGDDDVVQGVVVGKETQEVQTNQIYCFLRLASQFHVN